MTCPQHRHIQYTASTFVKLWKKYYNKEDNPVLMDTDSATSEEEIVTVTHKKRQILVESEEEPTPTPTPSTSLDKLDYEPKCMSCSSIEDEEHFLLCDNDDITVKHGTHLLCLDPPLQSIHRFTVRAKCIIITLMWSNVQIMH